MTLASRRMRAAVFAFALAAWVQVPSVGAAPPPWGNPARHDTPPPTPPRAPARRAPARPLPSPRTARGRASLRTAPPSEWTRVPGAELPENAPVERAADGEWIGAQDLARLLGATKYWRADLRKLELRAGTHRIQLTVDNPFVLVDDRTVALAMPVRSRAGELRAPVALIDSLPQDSTLMRLIYDAHRGRVLRVPPEGLVRAPRIEAEAGRVRVVFPTDRPEEATVVGRGRAHFRVRFGGLFVGGAPDSLPAGGLLRGARAIPATAGAAFEFALSPEVQGYTIERSRDGASVDIVFAREAGAGFERFAPEGPAGPRPVRVIVLDPGHGGADFGVTAGGTAEKDLTLALARELARQLQQRLGARVVFTRTDDRAPTMQQRAETANRAHADLVVSLHFDGGPSAAAHGVTAYCPPATYGGAPAPRISGVAPVEMLPWRDVATRHAVRSRELAEAVLSALELRGLGPSRLREVLPYPLLGVNAPGLLLECATLTSEADRTRLGRKEGIADLARAISAGLDAYGRAE